MKILVTGRGKSGSWRIRGEQLGGALGATVAPRASAALGYDVAVLVKRPDAALLGALREAAVPIVWDVVDAWPQPAGNSWDRDGCLLWLRAALATIRPAGIVAATEAMANDCEEFGVPALALPHHARAGAMRTPIRPLRVVGYEGAEQHLGRWGPWLAEECAKRGLEWRINPTSLSELDIVVALRDATGYAPRRWKSNVKLANAQATGTPIICAREAGYLETASGGECWADTQAEVAAGLDLLYSARERSARACTLAAGSLRLDFVAAKYLSWLETLCCTTAAKY